MRQLEMEIATLSGDDFDKVLQGLFISDNERAIEMFLEIRGVINRKHVSMEKRIAMIRHILRAGGFICLKGECHDEASRDQLRLWP